MKEPLSVRRCAECLSAFQFPLPDDPDQFYDEGYYDGTAAFSYQNDREVFPAGNIVYQARLKNIRKRVPTGAYLDVGCSMGGFVRAATEHYTAFGIDVSRFAIMEGLKWAEANPPRVDGFGGLYQGSLENMPRLLHQQKFSVISLIEVAEHLANPQASFAHAYKILEPGGVLVIQTANFEGWQAIRGGRGYHYFLPGHLVYYTATGLKNMLRSIGFQTFEEFIPVDFPLLAKLRKSRFRKWWRTSWYHLTSYLRWQGRPLTSSYVLYAYK